MASICIVVCVAWVALRLWPAARLAALPLVDDEVDRHLSLQTTDVPMTKIIAELVNLKFKENNIVKFKQ